MAVGRQLTAALASICPTWLQNLPGFRNLYLQLWTLAKLGDCLREVAWEGQLAAYPGVGTPTALPLIGASRGLSQGPAEPDAAFGARCADFRTAWAEAGQIERLARELQSYLVGVGALGAGVYPIVRIVERPKIGAAGGLALTLDASQVANFSLVAWNWDGGGRFVDDRVHQPAETIGWWADRWILIQDFTSHYTSFADPAWLAAWNSGDQTIDGLCPQAAVLGVMGIVNAFKGAHAYVRTIVLTPSPTTYTPDGLQGNASKIVAGASVISRSESIGYWDLRGG